MTISSAMPPTPAMNVDLASPLSVAVAKKAMDTAERQGAAAVELVKRAAAVQAQGAEACGCGGRLDVVG